MDFQSARIFLPAPTSQNVNNSQLWKIVSTVNPIVGSVSINSSCRRRCSRQVFPYKNKIYSKKTFFQTFCFQSKTRKEFLLCFKNCSCENSETETFESSICVEKQKLSRNFFKTLDNMKQVKNKMLLIVILTLFKKRK